MLSGTHTGLDLDLQCNMQPDLPNWESMLDEMKSNPEGTFLMCQEYGSTKSVALAGALLMALTKLRREEPKRAAEATSAIFGLLKTLPIWDLGPSMPQLMLSYLNSAIREEGVPADADRSAIAEVLERAATGGDITSRPLLEALHIALIHVCSSLVSGGELSAILAARPSSRDAVNMGVERISQQFRNDRALSERFSDEIEYVLGALRAKG